MAVVLASLIGGAVSATAVTLLVVDDGARNRYIVTVFLADNVTAADQTAVASTLSRLYPKSRVELRGREQTVEYVRKYFKDSDIIDGSEVGQSFHVDVVSTSIDCAALGPVKKMSGVRLVLVVQPPAEGRPHTLALQCP